MSLYLFLHLLGAVLLVGNIITAAFWKIRADMKGDLAVIHSAAKNVMLADFLFTIPGIILIIVTGNLMAIEAGYSLSGFSWVTLSQALFILTGVIWVVLLLPLQRSMIRHSAKALETGALHGAYRKASLIWAIFGTVATLLPVVILYLMIHKPV
ncbi:membrane protein [Paenibacillus beijingensis]|uniref:Membrane protein n=2 Tax=Paenibacillus beijingensis TaxID=1126833 RepID=A0A0D5NSC5_9BACL|nr:DUF2269 family protein [Paenibacillus beijingensis]AJY77803.1 membrane protein [Paenibacillus beijingensis]